ncbi:MAG TPA: aminopeptidase, partial [Nevskiaceae bacterium]|nr:aminopeptidase [Nevskiaceae bacterium]
VADPHTDEKLRSRLTRLQDARRFATAQLTLPDNGSYTQYADLKRPYAVWNVFAAPEFSLEPVQHCFLVIGCLSYRGYFAKDDAEAEAARLSAAGAEIYVAGIPAYSTLGWFDDPVLNTMMHWSDEVLVATLFHELTHQKFYLKGDTAFDESLASFVEDEGLKQYQDARGWHSDAYVIYQKRQQQVTALMLDARARLAALYAQKLPADETRRRKQAEFDRLRASYRALRDGEWHGYDGYDRMFNGELNNARMLPYGLYDQWQPAFAALYRQSGQQWPAFYDAVKKLAALPDEQRKEALNKLAGL